MNTFKKLLRKHAILKEQPLSQDRIDWGRLEHKSKTRDSSLMTFLGAAACGALLLTMLVLPDHSQTRGFDGVVLQSQFDQLTQIITQGEIR
jgi:hypothetical protein